MSIVLEALANVVINYRKENQGVTVSEIIELISVAPSSVFEPGRKNSLDEVTSCYRNRNEDLGMFVSLFRGLARDHYDVLGAFYVVASRWSFGCHTP